MILFLNGVSSSGKTTLSKCIQSISDKDFIRIGIDTFIDMMSPDYLYHGSKIDKGLSFTIEHTNLGPSINETHLGPLAKNFYILYQNILNYYQNNKLILLLMK